MVSLLIAVGMARAPQEAPRTRFSVAVNAVQVDVYVGRDDKAVLGLTRDDFELFDNGAPQQIELVDQTTVPLNVALVIDTSESVAGLRLVHLQRAAHAFLDELGEDDRASLVTFTQRVEERVPLTNDHGALHEAIDHIEARGATVWHDALYSGVKTVEDVTQRAIVLLFTDGQDTYSWLRPEQLPPLIEQSNAVLYGVMRQERFEPSGNTATRKWRRAWRRARAEHSEQTRLLRELTTASGGRLIETPSTAELERIFVTVVAEMKTRYLLTYRPTSPEDGWHEIQVKLKGQKADVRARRGYFYERAAP